MKTTTSKQIQRHLARLNSVDPPPPLESYERSLFEHTVIYRHAPSGRLQIVAIHEPIIDQTAEASPVELSERDSSRT